MNGLSYNSRDADRKENLRAYLTEPYFIRIALMCVCAHALIDNFNALEIWEKRMHPITSGFKNTLFFLFFSFQTSVLHMCSLFHAFIFAQLWTVYCEQAAVAPTVQNQNEFSFTAVLTALEFWSRVTPSILQLMAHNKVVSQMPRSETAAI